MLSACSVSAKLVGALAGSGPDSQLEWLAALHTDSSGIAAPTPAPCPCTPAVAPGTEVPGRHRLYSPAARHCLPGAGQSPSAAEPGRQLCITRGCPGTAEYAHHGAGAYILCNGLTSESRQHLCLAYVQTVYWLSPECPGAVHGDECIRVDTCATLCGVMSVTDNRISTTWMTAAGIGMPQAPLRQRSCCSRAGL